MLQRVRRHVLSHLVLRLAQRSGARRGVFDRRRDARVPRVRRRRRRGHRVVAPNVLERRRRELALGANRTELRAAFALETERLRAPSASERRAQPEGPRLRRPESPLASHPDARLVRLRRHLRTHQVRRVPSHELAHRTALGVRRPDLDVGDDSAGRATKPPAVGRGVVPGEVAAGEHLIGALDGAREAAPLLDVLRGVPVRRRACGAGD